MKKNAIRIVGHVPAASLVALGATVACILLAPTAWAAPVGFITATQGIAQVQPGGTATWSPAAIDGEIEVDDALRTERNSSMNALLVDDTRLTLGEDTEVIVDRMLVGDLATRERSILRETRGQLRAEIGKAFGATTRLEIHTPSAILGVKGSILEIMVNGGATTAVCVEGSCFARNIDPSISGEVQLEAGFATVIRQGQAPTAPGPPGPGYTPLQSSSSTEVASDSTDDQLFGEQSAGEELASETSQQTLEQQTLNSTNQPAQSVGPEEVFEDGGDAMGGSGGGFGGSGGRTGNHGSEDSNHSGSITIDPGQGPIGGGGNSGQPPLQRP